MHKTLLFFDHTGKQGHLMPTNGKYHCQIVDMQQNEATSIFEVPEGPFLEWLMDVCEMSPDDHPQHEQDEAIDDYEKYQQEMGKEAQEKSTGQLE